MWSWPCFLGSPQGLPTFYEGISSKATTQRPGTPKAPRSDVLLGLAFWMHHTTHNASLQWFLITFLLNYSGCVAHPQSYILGTRPPQKIKINQRRNTIQRTARLPLEEFQLLGVKALGVAALRVPHLAAGRLVVASGGFQDGEESWHRVHPGFYIDLPRSDGFVKDSEVEKAQFWRPIAILVYNLMAKSE